MATELSPSQPSKPQAETTWFLPTAWQRIGPGVSVLAGPGRRRWGRGRVVARHVVRFLYEVGDATSPYRAVRPHAGDINGSAESESPRQR